MKNNFKHEYELENILIKDLSLVEKGMKYIDSQVIIDEGRIDILARDKKGILCIIELKIVTNDTKLVSQCAYYPTQFNEPVRMITITPGYSNRIRKSLAVLDYIEMKKYTLANGSLIIDDYINENRPNSKKHNISDKVKKIKLYIDLCDNLNTIPTHLTNIFQLEDEIAKMEQLIGSNIKPKDDLLPEEIINLPMQMQICYKIKKWNREVDIKSYSEWIKKIGWSKYYNEYCDIETSKQLAFNACLNLSLTQSSRNHKKLIPPTKEQINYFEELLRNVNLYLSMLLHKGQQDYYIKLSNTSPSISEMRLAIDSLSNLQKLFREINKKENKKIKWSQVYYNLMIELEKQLFTIYFDVFEVLN